MNSIAPLQSHQPASGASSQQVISVWLWSTVRLLRRRWRMVVAITIATAVVAACGIILLTPRYEATALIKINPTPNALTSIENQTLAAPDQNLIDSEVAVMQSREIARAVTLRLKLDEDSEFSSTMPPRPAGPLSNSQVRNWYDTLSEKLLKHLTVERHRATYVVAVKSQATDPARAADIANAFAKEYIAFSVGFRTGTAEQSAVFLNKQLDTLGREVRAQDAQVARLQADAGTLQGGAGGSVLNQQLTPLSAQLATAQAEAAATRANLQAARNQMASGGIDAISGVLSSNVVADLRRQRSEVLREKGQVDSQFGPKYPDAIKIQQQLDQLDQQINDEAQRIINSLESEASSTAARAASLSEQLAALRGQQASNTRSAVLADGLAKQADAKRQTYSRVAQNLQQATTQARNTMTQAQIVETAAVPDKAVFPNKPLLASLGVVLGLALGVGAAMGTELLARGVRTAAELESRFDLPVIGYVPALSSSNLKLNGCSLNPADTIVERPASAYAEALRLTHSALTVNLDAKRHRIISLVSGLPNEGKSNSALALGRVMAMSGSKILLIDGDVRRAGLSRISGVERQSGLVELLQGKASVEDIIQADRVDNLHILPVATAQFIAQDLFSSDGMHALLTSLSATYDHIVIDTPPILGIADARRIASLSDAVLLAVKWNSTPVDVVEEVVASLRRDGSPLVGAIFTMVSMGADAVGPLAYTQYYKHYYQ